MFRLSIVGCARVYSIDSILQVYTIFKYKILHIPAPYKSRPQDTPVPIKIGHDFFNTSIIQGIKLEKILKDA